MAFHGYDMWQNTKAGDHLVGRFMLACVCLLCFIFSWQFSKID